MNPNILDLADQMKAGKRSGSKFVLMLGAGASIPSGVKLTNQIISELLNRFGRATEGDNNRERFNALWESLSADQRNDYLAPYLDNSPSPGYGKLAGLVRDGYIDTIITFNFDNLLQKALKQAGLDDEQSARSSLEATIRTRT